MFYGEAHVKSAWQKKELETKKYIYVVFFSM